ncbi:LCP family protein [Dactylosporangium sp. AC04546]|uniref:LCP family protein n=1 Tax=Dactylosporangium sp. AC04546 TaxID=2862460 RepID=UPI001EDE24D4|nr:LCP family protein [Dactylosporangium sp. AC04546]WVK83763.1 LCP family protein [Dactylosporangium sp. AC04546]
MEDKAPDATGVEAEEADKVEVPETTGTTEIADDAAPEQPVIDLGEDVSPPKPKKKANKRKLPGRDPAWAKALIVFGAVIVLIAGTALAGTQFLERRYSGSVHQETLLGDKSRVGGENPEERQSEVKGPLNFLLLGSDARALDPEDGSRSDSIIIVHIPASLDRAYLLSIPRDLRVRIPAFPETGFDGAAHEKINGAFQYGGGGKGGVQLLAETLTGLLGIRFDGAAIVNFDGFKAAVDLLGGVDMCIDQKVTSIHLGYDENGNYKDPTKGGRPAVYDAGCHHLESWQALDLVRQRKSLANGDYDRQKNQQKFIRALLDKAQKKDLTTNPIALDKFIRVIGQALTVDTNGVSLADLMFGLRKVSPDNLIGLQVPSEPQDIGGYSYVVGLPDAEALYAAMREDRLDSWAVENPTWVNHM